MAQHGARRGVDAEYSRYKQEDFKATGLTGSFNIDTRGTNASKSFNSLVAGNKRPAPKKDPIPASPASAPVPGIFWFEENI